MKTYLIPTGVWGLALGLVLSMLSVLESQAASQVIEFNLTVTGGEGVSSGGNAVADGAVIDESNWDEFVFGPGAYLLVKNEATGITYRVTSAEALEYLGNALATQTNGVAIQRWVVGGGVEDQQRSTLLTFLTDDSNGGSSESPASTQKVLGTNGESSAASDPGKPAATPTSP